MEKFEKQLGDIQTPPQERIPTFSTEEYDSQPKLISLQKENEELKELIKQRTADANSTIMKLAQLKKQAEDEC